MKILVVEDDPLIVRTLGELLEAEGYEVATTARQDEATALLAQSSFDLLLLDITLAQGNGFAVCAAARQAHPDMPVIFLTASDDEYSTVAGLDMGAVDYIAKPFRARELLSRMRVALRQNSSSAGTLRIGNLRLDPATAMVSKDGEEIVLSALEYRLLLYFLQNQGRLITREMLRDAIWDTAGEYVSTTPSTSTSAACANASRTIPRIRRSSSRPVDSATASERENERFAHCCAQASCFAPTVASRQPASRSLRRAPLYLRFTACLRAFAPYNRRTRSEGSTVNDSLTKHVVVLVALCIAVTGVTFLAVGVEAALCCAILSLVVFVFFLAVSLRRRSEIRRLTDEIDEVLNLGRRLSFSNCREGDIAVLANELEKMVARLSRLTSQIENEKTALADSLADISHQIRTPLTAAELMLPAIERATDEEQRKRLARDLEHLLDRVSWLVATLLKMAKVDAGALHMESRPVSVASMVARACAPLELSLDLRGIALVIEIPGNAHFTGDETWCAEAIENIVKNSMEHCQAGGTITIRAEEDALACHISISDDGPGISEEDLPHLFERFYRGTGSKEGEGFGVGLALARSLISGQGGTLRAANVPGEDGGSAGAVFEVAFPKIRV